MKIYNEYNNFYPIPTIRLYWDKFYEGGFSALNIELVWLRWTLALVLINK